MIRNIGPTDRILRIVIGIAAVGLGVAFGSWWGALGLIPIITAIIGWCPIYAPLHISTCAVKQEK